MQDGEFPNLQPYAAKMPVDAFYHLAWAGVSTTLKNDAAVQVSNITLTLKALYAAKQCKAKKVICPGSTSEYATCGEAVTGKNVPAPADMYAASKVAAHFMAQQYARQLDVPFIWLLIASIYGPGRHDNNVITYCINQLLDGKKPSTTKLEQQWDYLFVEDLIAALVLVGEKGVPGSVYPVGSGVSRPLAEFITTLRDKIDPALPLGIGEVPYKTEKIDHSIIDISLLQRDTGFMPAVSFEEGIEKTIAYFKSLREAKP
jgi:nucleoside-diphosphate-sugar epimerase